MVERKRYCPCTNHGFFLQVAIFVLFWFPDASMAAGAADSSSSLPLDKKQADIMRKLSSALGNRWNATLNPCDLRGVVSCSSSSSGSSLVVSKLTLRGLGISNSAVFDSICPLETLQFLDLSKNSILSLPNQSFPCAMSAGLRSLNLSSNRLSEPLANFTVFPKLEVLDLSFNEFSGQVSTDLLSLPKLRSLNLSTNVLEGDVPLPASTPLALQELVFSGNQFAGGIPKDLFRYSNLTVLDLSQNNLTGEVPNDFGELQKLQTLLLSGNNLSGRITASLSTLKNLSRFQANQNNFKGLIPSEITKHVKMLDLSYNKLMGMIPSHLFSPLGLESVDLTQNQLKGHITRNFSCNLYRLRLGSNMLTGDIPDTIEYAYTMRLTMAGNIYSFGVILLELLTGKPAVSEGIELAKWALSLSVRPDQRDQILDTRVSRTSAAVHSQMLSVLNIALSCVVFSPDARPKMRNILRSLLNAK